MKKLLLRMSRKKIIMESIKNRGLFIKQIATFRNCNIVNTIAPEHLELMYHDKKFKTN